MAVVEKTIDLIGDDAFCDLIISRKVAEGMPVDIYDEAVRKLRGSALRGMTGIQSLVLPNLTTCDGYALHEVKSLKRVSFPSCTYLGARVLQGCAALEEIDMPKLGSMGECEFTDCEALETVDLPSVTSTGSLAFYSCGKLKTVILPRLQTVGSSSFNGCPCIEQLDLPSVKSIQATAVANANALQVVNIGPNITSIVSTAFQNTPDGLVINLPVAEGVVANAPWGAPNAIINYEVPYSGKVPMPES